MPEKGFRSILSALMAFTRREQKGILLLIPLLIVVCLIFARLRRPHIEDSYLKYSDEVINNESGLRQGFQAPDPANASRSTDPEPPVSLFKFDPNSIDHSELVRLGFSPRQAQGIINYRNAGAVFRKPEDFAKCYTVSDEMFARLKPYINITFGQTEIGKQEPSADNSPLTAPETSPSASSADSIHNPNPPAASPVELNRADSATLVTIRGIGPATASRIVKYREMLGGYASVNQLTEIVGMTEQNYAMILQQISVESSEIQKIDINFASPQSMKGHPYMPRGVLNKILKHRQLKGGWSTIREMVEQDILTEDQAARLEPYLYFSGR